MLLLLVIQNSIAQSAGGGVEYTDVTSAEG